MIGPPIDPKILERLLALYFPDYPASQQDLERLVSELSEQSFTLTDIVKCCESVLPFSAPRSPIGAEFNKLAAEGLLTQNEALRLVVAVWKKLVSP